MTSIRHLHTVDDAEARLLQGRAAALRRFQQHYPKPESRRTILNALNRIARTHSEGECDIHTFPWELLGDDLFTELAWRSVADRYSPATAIRDAMALRVMLTCCQAAGLITASERAIAAGFSTKHVRIDSRPGRMLTSEEITRLVTYRPPTASDTLQARDAALVLTLASTGARRNELTHVTLADLTLATLQVNLRITKNGHPRHAWLHPTAATALQAWLHTRTDAAGPLITPLSRTGRPLLNRPLSGHQIWKILNRRGHQSGVGPVTPHDMRRFLASTLLDNGIDLLLTARILGHRSPTMTERYDRRPQDRMRAAIATLPLTLDLHA